MANEKGRQVQRGGLQGFNPAPVCTNEFLMNAENWDTLVPAGE